jgi:ATP-binding cassette subfamily B protein
MSLIRKERGMPNPQLHRAKRPLKSVALWILGMSTTPSDRDHAASYQTEPRSITEVLRRGAKYLKPYKWRAAANVACALLSLGFAFVFPQATQYIIDDVLTPGNLTLLPVAVSVLLAAFLFRDGFNALRGAINNTFEQNVIFDMRKDVYAHLQRLPIGYFDQRASGDLITRVIEDITNIERLLIEGTEQGTIALLSIVVCLIILFVKNPTLAAFSLVPLPMLLLGAVWFTLTAHRLFRGQRQTASAMNALLVDNLQGIRQIKAFNRQPHEDRRFERHADALRRGTIGVLHLWAFYVPAMTFLTAVGTVLVWWFGGKMVVEGTMTVGELVAFTFYLSLLYPPLVNLHGLNQLLQSARASSERLFDIMDAAEERPPSPAVTTLPDPVCGEVAYENVDFRYNECRVILENISLHANPGETIAVVGPTGSGKSTLVHLLPAFYQPSGGRITIDSRDIAMVSLESLRAQIEVVSQEPFLFNGTVRENIQYGKLDASEAELITASRAANCHDFIVGLPHGYESHVGERGVKLSVGEKQRITIARAILKDAPILILDEATASVDTATEALIQQALERLMRNRTCFVIAHRLSTVRRAHQILVLREGEIVERGTHDKLLKAGGAYARLWQFQSATLVDDALGQPETLSR